MAISWDTQITSVNLVSKRADVRFTRKDPRDWTDGLIK